MSMKYAVVDLGSNTIRLSVYNTLPGGGFDLLFSEKEMAGLVNEVEDGVLSQAGIRPGLRRAEKVPAPAGVLRRGARVQVFATCIAAEHPQHGGGGGYHPPGDGLSVDVVSGDQEAELGYYGALRTLDLRSGAMFDIGGGSTEDCGGAGGTHPAGSEPAGGLFESDLPAM